MGLGIAGDESGWWRDIYDFQRLMGAGEDFSSVLEPFLRGGLRGQCFLLLWQFS